MPDVDEVVNGEEGAQDEGGLAEGAAAGGLVARARAEEHLEAGFFAHGWRRRVVVVVVVVTGPAVGGG